MTNEPKSPTEEDKHHVETFFRQCAFLKRLFLRSWEKQMSLRKDLEKSIKKIEENLKKAEKRIGPSNQSCLSVLV